MDDGSCPAVGYDLPAMRIVGVLDLSGGRAVHAKGGTRERYEPVRSVAGRAIEPGNAVAEARAFLDLGVAELYAADLDAISGRGGQDVLVTSLAALGVPLWLDAGVTTPDRAAQALGLGAAHVIIGLETLSSYDALRDICRSVDADRVAFSLDLRNGAPVVAESGITADEPVEMLAARAADAGAGAIIVIDLARVGSGAGVDVELIQRVRASAPGVTLLAGGGVRGPDDLARLAGAGCDGALVATALIEGRLRS